MKQFQYATPKSVEEAISMLGADNNGKLIAGGIDLIGELKDHLIEPDVVVSVTDLEDLEYIKTDGGVTKIGVNAKITDIAHDETIRTKHTAVSDAAAVVGSPQIRNIGTLGGNLCQRPRCWYYRDEEYKCLKKGGHICFSVTGKNKYNAILGGGPSYIVHPSDCAPPLIALGAKVRISGPEGEKEMPLEDFFILPTQAPLTAENILKPNEMITEVEIPSHNFKSTYIKFREKEGFDWALSSVACALDLDGDNCKNANIVLGGVAPKPWRATKAEELLKGQKITEELAQQAGEAAVDGARPLGENEFKVPLTKAIVKDAILKLIA